MAVTDRDANQLELKGMRHTITVTDMRAPSQAETHVAFVEVLPQHTALLDLEDCYALRDWLDAFITRRENS